MLKSEDIGYINESHRSQSELFKAFRAQLSCLRKHGLIQSRHILDNIEQFFWCHEFCSEYLSPTLAYYMSVNFNLFAGTVIQLGTEKHAFALEDVDKTELGCFCMTEVEAGVYSGSVINTIAEWDAKKKVFRLHSRDAKYWISLGYQSKFGVVIANLVFKGENKGPHVFLVDFSKLSHVDTNGKEAAPGGEEEEHKGLTNAVSRELMPGKTLLVGLDNAVLRFHNVELARDALLDKYVQVTEEGEYEAEGGKFRFIRVLSRLLSGRLCIAVCAVAMLKAVVADLRRYAAAKEVHLFFDKYTKTTKTAAMDTLPKVRGCLARVAARIPKYEAYLEKVKGLYARDFAEPTPALTRGIFVAKSFLTYQVTRHINELKEVVGTIGLLQKSRLGQVGDTGYSLLVVEGDNNLLQQGIVKMLMDDVKRSPLSHSPLQPYTRKLYRLMAELALKGREEQMPAFLQKGLQVSEIAELYSAHVILG